jgi:hypothetical protein
MYEKWNKQLVQKGLDTHYKISNHTLGIQFWIGNDEKVADVLLSALNLADRAPTRFEAHVWDGDDTTVIVHRQPSETHCPIE